MKQFYNLVMDEDQNGLVGLPPAQKFQCMIVLSGMWVSLFCLGAGAWIWWGELMVGHAALAVGVALTAMTFRATEGSNETSRAPADDRC